jgi:hypothetical protein
LTGNSCSESETALFLCTGIKERDMAPARHARSSRWLGSLSALDQFQPFARRSSLTLRRMSKSNEMRMLEDWRTAGDKTENWQITLNY